MSNETISSLEQGAIFSDGIDLCIKTDEIEEGIEEGISDTTYYRCVVLAGGHTGISGHTGLIVHMTGDTVVTPKPGACIALESVLKTDTDPSAASE